MSPRNVLPFLFSALLAGFASNASAAPLTLLAAPSFQDEGGGDGGGDDSSGSGEAEPAVEDEGLDSEAMALVGGDVYTVTGPVLRGATVLVRKGKIKKIGYDIEIPNDAKSYDVSGMRVYPGLIAFGSVGLIGGTGDVTDTIDPFNPRMVLALAAGITATGQGSDVIKLKRYEIAGAVMKDAKPITTLAWTTRNPDSKRSLRDKLKSAAKYIRDYRKWEEDKKKDKELKEPSKKGVDSTVVSVLRGDITAKFNIDDRADLLSLARLAQEYGFRPIIDGAREAWTVADELGRAGATAIITPRERRWKEEILVREGGSSIENAAILYRSGVPVAILPQSKGVDLGGIVGRDIMHLAIEADFAVRGGLPEQAALEAITIVPARLFGHGHRIGSLEEGKDADIVITDGDILHYQTFVQYAFVDGKLVYDKEEELWFAHIRPRPVAELAPETKVDPGEVAPEEEAEAMGQPEEGEEPSEEPKDKEPEDSK